VQQVVMNLITNASEALEDRPGAIVLTTGHQQCDEDYLRRSRTTEKAAPGRFVFLEVTDDGCGMDEHVQQRLFDPFFTTKFTGRGLGMSAVLGVMRGHKGAILLSSEVGRGTTVRVLFPLVQTEIPAPPWPHDDGGNGELRELPDNRRVSGTVLVVDDEEPVRKLAGQVLERIGCRVLDAADGREAVQVFRQRADEIGCVLLDLTMPAMDGLRTYGELRTLRPDVRVILASGFDEVEISQRFAGQGLAGFIQKPYQLSTLTQEVRRVLAG
jgi:CheY-like chemotaxis protein